TALGLVALGMGLVWVGLPWGLSWTALLPDGRRLVVALALLPALLPACVGLAWGVQRLLGEAATRGDRLRAGVVWGSLAFALWLGQTRIAANHWPLFSAPVGLLAVSFLVPLPLWLLPHRPGLTPAR